MNLTNSKTSKNKNEKYILKNIYLKALGFVQQKKQETKSAMESSLRKKCSREMTKNNHPVKKIRQESDKKTSSLKNCRINLKRSAKKSSPQKMSNKSVQRNQEMIRSSISTQQYCFCISQFFVAFWLSKKNGDMDGHGKNVRVKPGDIHTRSYLS